MENNPKELNYLFVLKALDEIPFSVGRKLLVDFLQGKGNNESIHRNNLQDLKGFGSLVQSKSELNVIVDNLILNGTIQLVPFPGNEFVKMLELSERGRKEIKNPELYKRRLSFSSNSVETLITAEDRKLFSEFGDFLSRFNDEQKKSIISPSGHMLCIAGAGSGKTTVLTKRIEFLVRYRSVEPKKILAITFTRKARQEMVARLSRIAQTEGVVIETFNSFCEKILKKHNDVVYDRPVKVIDYGDKIRIVNGAMEKLNVGFHEAMDVYFGSQKRGKTDEQLFHIFLNDCFFIRDYLKFKNKFSRESFFEVVDRKHMRSAEMVFGICNYIEAYMKRHGLRDFADQLIDSISLFEKHRELIPEFDHVLVDEYQDINSTQVKLIDILKPRNLFCVGDPRQSIYGWRGSDIKYILSFRDKYPGCEITTLTRNYRSTKRIVELINNSIKNMKLVDLKAEIEGEGDIKLLSFGSEDEELEFVMQRILSSELPRNEIFVLARTNGQLNELSNRMKIRKIGHVVRSDEMKKDFLAEEGNVTLATIHAIKGLEAEMVFVIGCSGNNFPCKGSEHPVVEMVRMDEYDREEEEQRLFYVAMSRARNSLYLTYIGKKPTYFVTDEMLRIIKEDFSKDSKLEKIGSEIYDRAGLKLHKRKSFGENRIEVLSKGLSINNEIVERLRDWRRRISKELNIPAFTVIHNKALVGIVQRMPKTLSDLERVGGIGPAKIEKYGEEILRIVKDGLH